MENNKFYNFINNNTDITELYVYGDIIGGSEKWDEADVTFKDFKDGLNGITDKSTLNMYINSCGGSVFTTQAICSLIQRAKDTKNITVNAYIDGLGASCASWLPMMADNIYIYPQSVMMIHKPMSIAMGNADEMQKQIDILDKLEDDVIVPFYMNKCKKDKTKDEIKEMMTNETWLSCEEIQNIFDVTLLEDKKKISCCVDSKFIDTYKHIPKDLLENNESIDEKLENIETIKNIEDELKKLDIYLELNK